VELNKSQLSDYRVFTDVKHTQFLLTDTGKQLMQRQAFRFSNDSDEVIIIPDSGMTQNIHIAPNTAFTYVGKAKYINYRTQNKRLDSINKTIYQTKGFNTHLISSDSLIKQNKSTQITKNKTIKAKTNYIWLKLTICITGVLVLLIIYKKKEYFNLFCYHTKTSL